MSNSSKTAVLSLDPHRQDLCEAVFARCAPELENRPDSAGAFLSALYQHLCARMFPDGLPEVPALTADEALYLDVLESALSGSTDSFDPYLDLLPLPEEALAGSRVEAQYRLFRQAVREDHVLAVMRLGMETTPFDPASHTIGVHNIALHTAILAKKAGFPVVIVKDDSAIASVDDLFADGANTVVGTQAGTTGFIYATSDIEDAGLGTVKSFGKTTDAVEALKNGQVDCVILDNEPAKALVAANEGLHILDTEYAVEDYAIAIAKENTDLLDKVNAALAELKDDGTLQSIVDKYIGE